MIKKIFAVILIMLTIATMGFILAARIPSNTGLSYKDRLGIFDDITNGTY